MKDRIQKFLVAEGLSPAKLADELGVQRSSISHLLSGRNKPSYDFIYKFSLRYATVNLDWLITGRGEMYRSKSDNFQNSSLKITDNKTDKSTLISNDEKTVKNVTDVNNTNRVIIFYSDNSFEEYLPR